MSASTEIDLYQDRHPEAFIAEAIAHGDGRRDIVDGWVGVLMQVESLANVICDTEFVPKELKGKPAAITACFLTGRELGLGPMASLKHIQIIDGTPAMSAEYKRARILERGHQYKIVELTKLKCVILGRRRGDNEWTRFEYTIADAKQARLVRPRSNWEMRPKRMLLARASSDMCDAIFTEATNGLPTAELIADELDMDNGSDLTAPTGTGGDGEQKTPVRRRRRARAAAPEPEIDDQPEQPEQPEQDPELADENWDDPAEEEWIDEPVDDEPAADEPVSGEPMITGGQLTRVQAQAKNLRLNDEQRHRAASEITGRAIKSFKDLTEAEASDVIDIFSVAQRKSNPQAALKRLVASAVRDREEGTDDDLAADDLD